jgi:hypothetical protein
MEERGLVQEEQPGPEELAKEKKEPKQTTLTAAA